jgi:1-acyl-sn-glycerol-3-phosphate acyltransferase
VQIAYLTIVGTIAFLVLGPVVVALLYLLPDGRPVRVLSRVAARLALAISGCRVTVEGAERLRGRGAGPLVLVTNHTSYADAPVLLAALPIDFVFVAMREIVHWPVIGTFARRGSHPTVDRWRPTQSVADEADIHARLRNGESVLFFAEGGFSAMRGLKPFRLGAFAAAAATDAPVVPIALRGSRELLRADTRIPRPGRVHVWIGEPLRSEIPGWRGAVALRDHAAEAIAAHCGEPIVAVPVARQGPPGAPA